MGYSIKEIYDIKARIDAVLADGRLDAWETRFLGDVRNRFERYGVNARLSKRQVGKLREILGTASVPVSYQTHRTPIGSSQRRNWYPRRRSFLAREARWWTRRFVRDFAIITALLIGAVAYSFVDRIEFPAFSISRPSSEPVLTNRFTVTDGDTIRFQGEAKGTRLVGFNAPETSGAQCSGERELGFRAADRLREMVATSVLTFEKVRCSCRAGTEGTEACNYGRSCGILRADGRDVGEILISEGLAVPFRCGALSCPPTPRPWCG